MDSIHKDSSGSGARRYELLGKPKTTALTIRTVDDASAPTLLASVVHRAMNCRAGRFSKPSAVNDLAVAVIQWARLAAGGGSTALTQSIEKCRNDGLNLDGILEEEINAMDGLGRTPLTLAVESGASTGLVTILFNKKASANQADARGYTPLALAARSGNMALINLLIGKGASSRVPGWAPRGTLSPLAQATRKPLGYGRAMKEKMKQAQAECLAVMTALYTALLAEGQAGVGQQGSADRPPFVDAQIAEALRHAAENSCVEAVEFLLQVEGKSMSKACIDAALAKVCGSPAVASRSLEVVQLLAAQGANLQDYKILRSAIQAGQMNVVDFLLEKTKETAWVDPIASRMVTASIKSANPAMFERIWPRAKNIMQTVALATNLEIAVAEGHMNAIETLALPKVMALFSDVPSPFAMAAVKNGAPKIFDWVWSRVSGVVTRDEMLALLEQEEVRNPPILAAIYNTLFATGYVIWRVEEYVPILHIALDAHDTGLEACISKLLCEQVQSGQGEPVLKAILESAWPSLKSRASLETKHRALDILLAYFEPSADLLVCAAVDHPKLSLALLSHPRCASAWAEAAERLWDTRTIDRLCEFVLLANGQMDLIAAQVLPKAVSVNGVRRFLKYGAGTLAHKSAVFSALRSVCKSGRICWDLSTLALLDTEAGRALSSDECKELWRLVPHHAKKFEQDRELKQRAGLI